MTEPGREGSCGERSERSPRLAAWLLKLLAGSELGPIVAEELDEEFRCFALHERGPWRARLWYWGQAVRSTPYLLHARLVGHSGAETPRARRSGVAGGPSDPGDGPLRRAFDSTRFALRVLLRRPVLSCAAVLTLALALGFSTASYGVLEAVVLRSLPYASPEDLVWVHPDAPVAPAHVDAIATGTRSLSEVSAFERRLFSFLDGGLDPDMLRGAAVTPNHFRLLGSQPILGRSFLPEEGLEGAGSVIILSHGVWTSRYGADPAVVGRTIDLGLPSRYRVVGVMGPDHRPIEEDWAAWVPLVSDPQSDGWDAWRSAYILGRLSGQATPEAVNSEVRSALEAYIARVPDTALGPEELEEIRVEPLMKVIVGPVRQGVLAATVGVGLLLLIACANVGNLLMALASARQKELAVRRALGASRATIVRQLFTEGMVVSVLGGVLGVALAYGTLPLVAGLLPPEIPRSDTIGISPTVLLVGGILTLVAGGLAGVLPATLLSRGDPGAALTGGRGDGPLRATRRTHAGLVVFESALAVIVAVGAGLLFRSFSAALSEDPGFEPDNVVALRPALSRARYQTDDDRSRFFLDAQERLAALPGVEEVGGILFLPMTSGGWYGQWAAIGTDLDDQDSWKGISNRTVLPGYFESMGIEVVGGRTLSHADLADPRVTVLNETAARALFGDGDPVGREVTPERDLPPRRVVGVVEDVRQRSLDAPPLPEMYHPITAEPVGGGLYLTLRTSSDPNDALTAARRALLEMDPRLPISHAERLTDTVQRSLLIRRVSAWGAAAFGVFALLLGAVGIYGVTAFQVSTRKRDVGVRVALGAGSPRIMRSIVGRGILPVLAGVTLGLILVWTMGGALESLVYGVTARDPSTLLGVAAVLMFVALLALLGPATRATRTEPAMVLNDE